MVTTEEQLKELQSLQKIAEAKKAIAEAEKAVLDARFPKGESKPLEGKIETDEKFGYTSEIVAYEAMEGLADRINGRINHLLFDTSVLLVVDTLSFGQSIYSLIDVETRLKFFKEQFGEISKKFDELMAGPLPPLDDAARALLTPVLVGAVSTLSLLADIAGYFKVNYSVKGREFKLSDEALIANVVNRIGQGKKYIFNFNHISTSMILEDIGNLLNRRTEIEMKKEVLIKRNSNDDSLIRWPTLSVEFDNYLKSISVAPEGQQPTLVLAAIHEQVRAKGVTHLLYLKVVSSGGEAITKEASNIRRGGDTAFIGGGAVTFVLARLDGEVVASGTVSGLSRLDYKLSDKNPPKIENIEGI